MLEQHFPDQNILMNAAKGRVSQYLTSLKPQENTPRLPFDPKPDQTTAHKAYDDAVSIAAKPLSVVKNIKNGSITTDQLKHLTQLYPEVYSQLSKKITAGITQSQLNDETVPYKTRQAMSLFLGTPLDSTMSPTSIQAAQMVFKAKQSPQPQGQPPKMGKKGTSNL